MNQAHSWRIRVRLWAFVLVRRVADLPFSFATVHPVGLDDIPKLIQTLVATDAVDLRRWQHTVATANADYGMVQSKATSTDNSRSHRGFHSRTVDVSIVSSQVVGPRLQHGREVSSSRGNSLRPISFAEAPDFHRASHRNTQGGDKSLLSRRCGRVSPMEELPPEGCLTA